jgi:hypothetical protein
VPDSVATIQGAIDSSVDGDTVLVSPGAYQENINFNGKNIIVGSLTLSTGDTSYISQTIIDGNQNGSVVSFDSGEDSTAILMGFTLINGSGSLYSYGQLYGGGIFCAKSSPKISDIYITNIPSGNITGGCIFIDSSEIQISNLYISNLNDM